MSISKILCFHFIIILFTNQVYSQEINITEFRSEPLDIAGRENTVYDANGDACALFKVRSGLGDLIFSTDLEIRTIEQKIGEYWLWVSPGTSYLDVEAEGIGFVRYDLPIKIEGYMVYVMLIVATLPDMLIYNELKSLEITSSPSGAEIYIDTIYMGKTPINLSLPKDSAEIVLRKKKWITESGHFKISDLNNSLQFSLRKDHYARRMHIIVKTSYNNFGTPFPSIQIGMFGKTSWYFSTYIPIFPLLKRNMEVNMGSISSSIESDLFYDDDGELDLSYFSNFPYGWDGSESNYYYRLKNDNNTYEGNARITAGITQQITKYLFVYLGLGYGQSSRYYVFNKIPYSNNVDEEFTLDGNYYGMGKTDFKGVISDIGICFRIKNRLLVNLAFSPGLINTQPDLKDKVTDFTFGMGYNF